MIPSNLSGFNLLILCFHSTHCPALLHLLQKKKSKVWICQNPLSKNKILFHFKGYLDIISVFYKDYKSLR